MAKKFNITGTCIPAKHYMADTSDKLRKVLDLIEAGEYFTINRPRQYGKTTTMSVMNRLLQTKPEYLSILTSFEGVGDLVFQDEKSFSGMFLELLEKRIRQQGFLNWADFLKAESLITTGLKEMSVTITELVRRSGKKIVLFIDEVDKSSKARKLMKS